MRYFVATLVLILALLFVGCGSAGQMTGPNPATLYVTSLSPSSVLRLDHASTANGNVAPIAISNSTTLAGAINGMVVDSAANRLFISSVQVAPSILIFDNASAKAGNVAPDRVVTGTATTLGFVPGPVALDASRDLLYVSNGTSIAIFNNASTMNGNVAPLSTLSAPFITSTVGGLALDQANDRLFVSSPFTHEIICFDHASQLGSMPTGSRLISGPNTGLAGPQALALDKNGTLFVGNVLAGITVYANAGGIAGDVAPTSIIQGNNTQFHIPILLAINNNPGGADSGDLYVMDSGGISGHTIVVFTDIGNVNGNVSPSRILTFPTALGNALTLDSTR